MCLRRCKNQNFNMTFSFLSIKNLKTDILAKRHVMASSARRSDYGLRPPRTAILSKMSLLRFSILKKLNIVLKF